jgi:hypothetical protein
MHAYLMIIPAAVKVGVTFLAILTANRLGLPLGLAILFSSITLSFWAGMDGRDILNQLSSFQKPENYLLPVVIFLLLFFTETLNRTGRIDQILEAMKSWLKNRRLLYVGLPALVGLLPMPGGALFSAPLVDSVDSEKGIGGTLKAAVNYWFRHIWEYWWPLYPGVILAIRYSGLPFELFLIIQAPFTLAALAGGYLFIMKKVKKSVAETVAGGNGPLPVSELLYGSGPIILLIVISIAGSVLLPFQGFSGSLASLLAMLAGLILATAMAFRGCGEAWKDTLKFLGKPHAWNMILLVISIQVFSAVLQYPLGASGKTIVAVMRDEFVAYGIPIVLLIAVIPFISGMATGVAFGFVGASFPIVFALIGENPGLHVAAAVTALAYASGYAGMMLSPLHICYVVTCEYFQTTLWRTYRYIIGPTVIMIFSAIVLSIVYYHLF